MGGPEKRLYYYVARRENGRAVRQYTRSGPAAGASAALLAMDRGRLVEAPPESRVVEPENGSGA